MLSVTCPQCNKNETRPDDRAGWTIVCDCGRELKLPGQPAPEPEWDDEYDDEEPNSVTVYFGGPTMAEMCMGSLVFGVLCSILFVIGWVLFHLGVIV